MSKYIPNTKLQVEEMLASIGIDDVQKLFDVIPDMVKYKKELNLPEKMTEQELISYFTKLQNKNKTIDSNICFLGAGAYDHYIPIIIDHIISRQEFYTAYTPYQPEISQGILQAIFEYQTMICRLTGMDACNASMYDGQTSLAEACSLAYASTSNKRKILLLDSINEQAKQVVKTYLRYRDIIVKEVSMDTINDEIDDNTAGVCVQIPNYYGEIEEFNELSNKVHEKKGLFIVYTDPISLGILEKPSEYGADIVVGEGQGLGNALGYGGPYLGFFAVVSKLMRKMPGRIVGQTIDKEGKRAFVLTLQTREQHIRREKATSNICSNQALNALIATIYLSTVGKEGLIEIATRCAINAHYTFNKLIESGNFEKVSNKPFFKEFVVKSKISISKLNKHLLKNGYLGGYDLGNNLWLVAVTEKRTKEEIDNFVKKAGEIK